MVKLAEYLSMSRPIVAFDLAESRLSAGEAALYATPNQAASFAARIDELLEDPERRSRMGSLGRERVEQVLSWQRSEEQLLAAYERTLGLGRRPRLQTLLREDRGRLEPQCS
jgi:glycosyltransferase involved in cell wall biosynthesis